MHAAGLATQLGVQPTKADREKLNRYPPARVFTTVRTRDGAESGLERHERQKGKASFSFRSLKPPASTGVDSDTARAAEGTLVSGPLGGMYRRLLPMQRWLLIG